IPDGAVGRRNTRRASPFYRVRARSQGTRRSRAARAGTAVRTDPHVPPHGNGPDGGDGRARAEPAADRDKQLHGSRGGTAGPRQYATRRKTSKCYGTRGRAGGARWPDHPAPALAFVARRKQTADRSPAAAG